MDPRSETWTTARREIVLGTVVLVALARAVEGPGAWLVGALVGAAVMIAGLRALGRPEDRGVPFASLLVPAVLAAGAAGAIRLVPPGLGLIPALTAFGFALNWLLRLEMRLLAQPAGTSDADRARVLLGVVGAAFVAFTGVAALVPGGLVEPSAGGVPGVANAGSSALPESWLIVLAVDDAVVALLLGYRAAALRYGSLRDALWSSTTYAIVIAIAAGAVRAIDLPRLVAPAVLTLVLYLWDAVHGTAPARRREPRFLWETLLLLVLGAVVVAWNFRLRP